MKKKKLTLADLKKVKGGKFARTTETTFSAEDPNDKKVPSGGPEVEKDGNKGGDSSPI